MANWWLGLATFPIMIIIVIMSGLRMRKDNGGYLKVGEGFLGMFLTGVIISVIGTLWSIILMNVIDPELTQLLVEETIAKTYEFMSGFGMPEEDMRNALKEAKEGIEEGFTVVGQLTSIFSSAIWWAFVAIVVALIIKRNPPVEMNQADTVQHAG